MSTQERLNHEHSDEVVSLRELVRKLQAEVEQMKEKERLRERDPYLAEHEHVRTPGCCGNC